MPLAVARQCRSPRARCALAALVWFEALRGFRRDHQQPPHVERRRGGACLRARLALDGGVDGYAAFREILAAAPAHLAPGGALLLEHGHEQRAALKALAEADGWLVAAVRDDLASRARVLVLTRSVAP
jgi:release factor glutamine methyltransferase